MDERLLTIDEAAKVLAIKVSTLRAAILRRQISYVKVGRLVRFKLKDLEQFIERNTKEANM